jgi:hypothetical protein
MGSIAALRTIAAKSNFDRLSSAAKIDENPIKTSVMLGYEISLKGCAGRSNSATFVHKILIARGMLINLGAGPGKS